MKPQPPNRVYCLNLKRQATTTTNHLGHLTCECGDRVEPFIWKRKDTA